MKAIHSSTQHQFARPAVLGTGIGGCSSVRLNMVKLLTVLLGLFSLGASKALASDPVGIYAIVDKVVFEPNGTSPERIQLWGAFAIAEGYGSTYKKAERGYLYYKLNTDKANACRNEWSDLKSVAGTRQIVAFASRYGEKGALRMKDARPENPDVYPIAMGLKKVSAEKDYAPLQQLAKLRDAKPKQKSRAPASEKK